MLENRAADLIWAAGCGTLFILLAMPEAERDLGRLIAARGTMIGCHRDGNAGATGAWRCNGGDNAPRILSEESSLTLYERQLLLE